MQVKCVQKLHSSYCYNLYDLRNREPGKLYFKRYFNKYKLFLETKIKYKLDWMEIEMFKHIKKLNKKKTKKQQLKL